MNSLVISETLREFSITPVDAQTNASFYLMPSFQYLSLFEFMRLVNIFMRFPYVIGSPPSIRLNIGGCK